MKLLKEGDREKAFHPKSGKLVEIVYKRQWFHRKSRGVDVFTLVGVYEPTGEVIIIPPQSTPDIKAAIDRAKAGATSEKPKAKKED